MNVDHEEYVFVLKKFLNYVEKCDVIFDYIKDCGNPTFDVATEVNTVSKSYGRMYLDLGETEQAEISNIYHVLKYIANNNLQIQHGLAYGYDISSSKYQDRVKAFNVRVVLVLIRHIEGYLTKIGIDMGVDETMKYSITVNNGQVNLATDNSVINATQNNGINYMELKALIDALRNELNESMNSEDVEAVKESIEVIESELAQQNPKKSLIKTALTTIQVVKGTVEFSAAVAALVQFIQNIL